MNYGFRDKLAITVVLVGIGIISVALIVSLVALVIQCPPLFYVAIGVAAFVWALSRVIDHNLKMPWEQ